MRILKRLFLAVFGTVCCLTGLVALLLAVALLCLGYSTIVDPLGRVYMVIAALVMCEMFFAFGVTAVLLGVGYILNRGERYKAIVDKYWAKAMTCALVLPLIGFAVAGIALVAQRFFAD